MGEMSLTMVSEMSSLVKGIPFKELMFEIKVPLRDKDESSLFLSSSRSANVVKLHCSSFNGSNFREAKSEAGILFIFKVVIDRFFSGERSFTLVNEIFKF